MFRKSARRLLLPLMLSLTLVGCATSSTPLVVRPANVPPPAPELMQEPDLSESYSDSVRRLLQQWLQKLTEWRRSS